MTVGAATCIFGTSNYSASTAAHAALPHHGGDNGCYQVRLLDGSWNKISVGTGGTNNDFYLWPYFNDITDINNPAALPIDPAGGTFSLSQQISPTDAPTDEILRSTGGDEGFSPLPFGVGNQTHPVTPYILIQDRFGSGLSQVLGELEGIFSINGEGLSAEDRVDLPDGRVAVVLPNINSTANDLFYAMLEE